MTIEPIDEPTSVEPVDDANASPPEPVDDDEQVVDLKTVKKLRHEAAGLRVQLKEARAANAELESAATRIAALERAEVERIASADLIDGSDIWSVRPDLQEYYDAEFKQIQPDRVREATAALIAQKPHLAKQVPPPPTQQPIESLRSGARPAEEPKPITWSSALRRTGL